MPKLPADLPENWTRGQLVSPNGTEVGLTEKHGYNYLMKQVNATQTEVNNINTALTDVAQQETVNEIKNKIGAESDADTQPTLFGRLAQLKNVLMEKLAEVLTKVTGIDGKIGTIGDTAEDETLFGKLSQGAIKSVQRGTVSVQNATDKAVTISSVNPKKCMVTIKSSLKINDTQNENKTISDACFVKSLTATKLTIGNYDVKGFVNYVGTVSWEVCEFY